MNLVWILWRPNVNLKSECHMDLIESSTDLFEYNMDWKLARISNML